jgi:enoyl-CoA hydratase/carnithine racemase
LEVEKYLLVAKEKGVANLLINRPEVHNVLTGEMYRDLAQNLYDLDKDDEIAVIVIKGAGGRAFCAGSDVNYFLNKTVLERQNHFSNVAELMQAPSKISKPVIAAVQGYAFGGGCALAAACDIAIAAETSLLGLPEVELGIFPMTIAPVIIRRVGVHKAFELLMMGKKLSGREAAEVRLINIAVPQEDFELEINRYADKLASLTPVAVRMGKTAFYNCVDMEYLKAIKYMGNMMAINASSDDCAEGIAAFFEKRVPHWQGH